MRDIRKKFLPDGFQSLQSRHVEEDAEGPGDGSAGRCAQGHHAQVEDSSLRIARLYLHADTFGAAHAVEKGIVDGRIARDLGNPAFNWRANVGEQSLRSLI